MEECVILFLHHKFDSISIHHLKTLERYNSHFKVVSLTPNSNKRSLLWSYENLWMHNDTMIYDWIDSNNFINAKRYCWFDWDTLCGEPVDEYYGDSWNAEMVGTNYFDINNNYQWQWFRHARKFNELAKYFHIMKGLTPFCGILASKEALLYSLEKMKEEYSLWKYQMNELRLPTCANLVGIKLSTTGNNSVQPFAQCIGPKGKILHPIKMLNNHD